MTATSINIPLHSESDVSRTTPQSVFIVVMGVSGTGKSTLGNALAKELGLPYVEGDDLHPKANIDKMTSGVPLTDEDRVPWLELIRTAAESESHRASMSPGGTSDLGRRSGAVITCSALKKCYRDILRGKAGRSATSPAERSPHAERLSTPDEGVLSTFFVWIDGPKEVLQERMEKREGHFMKASMLESQLKALESPEGEEGAVTVPLKASTQEQVRIAIEKLGTFLPGLTTATLEEH